MGSALSYIFGGPAEASTGADDSSSEPSCVITFDSSERWKLHFKRSKESPKLMVVDFSASWCGPCKIIAPFVESLASKYQEIEFIKIDVDKLPDAAQEFKVQAMPTFVLLKQGKEVGRVIGAKKEELEKIVLMNRETPKFAA